VHYSGGSLVLGGPYWDSPAGVVTNLPSGQFYADGDCQIVLQNGIPANAFNNQGLFVRIGFGDDDGARLAVLQQQRDGGSADRDAVFGAGSSTGTFTVASGATLEFGGGNYQHYLARDPWSMGVVLRL